MKKQFSGYLVVALIGLMVDFGTLTFTKEVLGFNYLVAATAGFLAGLIVNYILSSKYVFKNPKIASGGVNFLLFGVIGLVGLGLLNLLMWGMVGGLGLNYILAKIVATGFVYIWNFFGRAALYHGDKKAGAEETPAESL